MHRIDEAGKITAKQALCDFWVGFFDYMGKTTRRGYGWAVLWCTGIYFVSSYISSLFFNYTSFYKVGVCIVVITFLIFLIGILALSFRRLRDIGINGRATLCLIAINLLFSVFLPIFDLILIIALNLSIILVPSGKWKTTSQNGFMKFIFVTEKGENE